MLSYMEGDELTIIPTYTCTFSCKYCSEKILEKAVSHIVKAVG